MDYFDPDAVPATTFHRWLPLHDMQELDAWLDLNDRELRKLIGDTPEPGYGICLRLQLGGEIYIHTSGLGDVILDVTEEAEWVSPAISAATGVAAPRGQIWHLPEGSLPKLIFGLNSLIDASCLVLAHRFPGMRRY